MVYRLKVVNLSNHAKGVMLEAKVFSGDTFLFPSRYVIVQVAHVRCCLSAKAPIVLPWY